MWYCSLCDKTFEVRESYAGHRSAHRRRGEIPASVGKPHATRECLICDLKFDSANKCAGHRSLMHSDWDLIKTDARRKARLINERGRCCQICMITSWMGQLVPIEIDHIDGNPENSSKENFRLICPNCHAQTSTYKGRNIGKVLNSKRAIKLKQNYGKYR